MKPAHGRTYLSCGAHSPMVILLSIILFTGHIAGNVFAHG
jgi:hypothetical protein